MKTSQYFPLVFSSFVSGAMLFSYPATSAVFQIEASNPSTFPLVGNRFVYAGIAGRPLNIISLTSPEFPITQIGNNNTPQVAASFVGGALPPGSPFSIDVNIEDYPDGTAGFTFLEAVSIVATPNGLKEEPLPLFTLKSDTSVGAQTPFSAFKVKISTEVNGQVFEVNAIYQLPGDQISFSDRTDFTPVTFEISSQAIPGYVPVDQLNDFPPPTEFILLPGENLTFTNPQQLPSTPEPSVIASLSALSLGAFLKRKLAS